MRCPICDSWTSVLETREGEHCTTKRRRECANGHRFGSVEVTTSMYSHARPAMQHSITAILRRIARWKRDEAIVRDPRSGPALALALGLEVSGIQKIRAAFRRKAAEPH